MLTVWLHKPHVLKWWRDPKETLCEVEEKYGGRVVGDDPTDVYISLFGAAPIGLIQSYRIDDYPEHAESIKFNNAVGVDLFIGEEDFIGKGYGPMMLVQFVEKVIRNNYTGADFVVADPEVTNMASIQAFEKAGFHKAEVVEGEYGPEQLMILNL